MMIVISLILLSTVTRSLCSANSPIQTSTTIEDTVKSGLYSIQGCGSNASQIVATLESMQTFLQPAIIDAEQIYTSAAYNTFFKDVDSALFVCNILQNAASGTPVVPGVAQPGFGREMSPVIICIPEASIANPDPKSVRLTTLVQTVAGKDCGIEGAVALFIGGTNIIALCPAWFASDHPMEPRSQRPCIAVDRAVNLFRGSGGPMSRNARASLLHALTHLYLIAETNQKVPDREVYTINSCFLSNARSQKYMPNNYIYYASSVFYECSEFPTVSPPERELAASLDITTNDVAWANDTVGD